MARHCAEQPTVFHALVGIALMGIMNHELAEMNQLPQLPNLYWAITALPEPPVDLQPAFEMEPAYYESAFPDFAKAIADGTPTKQWLMILEQMIRNPPWVQLARGPLVQDETTGESRRREDLDAVVQKALPVAKGVLDGAGVPKREIEEMSPAEAIVRAGFSGYGTYSEELGKWARIPFWQAKPGLERDLAELGRLLNRAGVEGGQEASYMAVFMSVSRCQRGLAGLRCLEAIRLYAATHRGKLPRRLEDIQEVPIPVNPLTGKSFPYRAEERYVILDLDGDFALNYQWWIRLPDDVAAQPGD